MSNRIDVQQAWMVHEGGTKFYQVFQFIATGGKAVTLTHWGKNTGGAWLRPVLGGETQVKPGAQLKAKTAAKVKRGYKLQDSRNSVTKRDDYWLTTTFGAPLAWELTNAMFGAEPAAIEPSPAPDTEVIPGAADPIEERPASWGTW